MRTIVGMLALLAGCSGGNELPPLNDVGDSPTLDTDGDGVTDIDEDIIHGTDPDDADTDDDGLNDGQELNGAKGSLCAQLWNSCISNPTLPDSESPPDGLTDYEEVMVYGTNPRLVDTDADGLNDLDELIEHGTDPNLDDTDGDGIHDNEELSETRTDPLNKDTDGDGLYDGQEVGRGTDPKGFDSDYDGIGDFDESRVYGTDPLSADTDVDGLYDGDELFTIGTDPNAADTDRDGLEDADELDEDTDPFDPDSDDDGLSDGTEVRGWNPQLGYNSDPLDVDTDGDGLTDDEEHDEGTNPRAEDTDLDGLTDIVELDITLTDPTDADTDDDSLEDGVEDAVYGTVPLDFDSDDDGLSDGDEIEVHSTNPLVADTDGDGLDDGEEIITFGSCPSPDAPGCHPPSTDTDGDGLLDGEEVDVHFTQPAVADTDGDGLDDGVEILILGFDPLVTDMDDDGAADGLEIDVMSTDAYDRDTDRDGLTDGDEQFTFMTDPDDADSDHTAPDIGDDDGAEVGRGSDPNDPTDDLVCAWPTTDRPGTPDAPLGPDMEPTCLRVEWAGMVVGGHFEDYTYNSSPRSSKLVFSFIEAGTVLCSLEYDLSTTESSPTTWATDTGALLWAQFDVELANGWSNCRSVDPLAYGGFTDLRDLVEAIPWGIGYGELDEHVAQLQAQAAADGHDYATKYEPYALGYYVTMDRAVATELGYAMGVEAACADVPTELSWVHVPAVTEAAMPDEYYETYSLEMLTLVDVVDALP